MQKKDFQNFMIILLLQKDGLIHQNKIFGQIIFGVYYLKILSNILLFAQKIIVIIVLYGRLL